MKYNFSCLLTTRRIIIAPSFEIKSSYSMKPANCYDLTSKLLWTVNGTDRTMAKNGRNHFKFTVFTCSPHYHDWLTELPTKSVTAAQSRIWSRFWYWFQKLWDKHSAFYTHHISILTEELVRKQQENILILNINSVLNTIHCTRKSAVKQIAKWYSYNLPWYR